MIRLSCKKWDWLWLSAWKCQRMRDDGLTNLSYGGSLCDSLKSQDFGPSPYSRDDGWLRFDQSQIYWIMMLLCNIILAYL